MQTVLRAGVQALVREGRVLNDRNQPDHVLSQIPMPES